MALPSTAAPTVALSATAAPAVASAAGDVQVDSALVDQAIAAGVQPCWAIAAVYNLSKTAATTTAAAAASGDSTASGGKVGGAMAAVTLDAIVRKAASLEFAGKTLLPPQAEIRPHEVVFGAVEGENRGEKPFAQQRRRVDNYFWLRVSRHAGALRGAASIAARAAAAAAAAATALWLLLCLLCSYCSSYCL